MVVWGCLLRPSVLGFVGVFTPSVRYIVRNTREGRGRTLRTTPPTRNSHNSHARQGIAQVPEQFAVYVASLYGGSRGVLVTLLSVTVNMGHCYSHKLGSGSHLVDTRGRAVLIPSPVVLCIPLYYKASLCMYP